MAGMSNNDYISLLEQAVSSNAMTSLTKGMDGVPGKTRRTGSEAGMKYRAASIGGDDIINWDGEGKLSHSEELDDIDELVNGIKHESDDYEDNDFSPMSILESSSSMSEDDDDEENHLDVDEQMEESVASNNFTSTESEIISKLIREMQILESEGCNFDNDDDDDDVSDDTNPQLDLDDNDDD